MFVFQEHTTEYIGLLRKIRTIASLGGLEFGDTPRKSHLWRFYRIFCAIIYLPYVLLNWSAIYTTRAHPIAFLLQIGMGGGILASLSVGYDLNFNGKRFFKIFIRVGKFEKQYLSPYFIKAFQKSQSAIVASAIFTSARFFLVVLFTLIIQLLHKPVWTKDGNFNIKLPLRFYLPLIGPPQDWTTFGINYVFQFIGAFLSLFNYGFFMVIVSVLVLFSVASMNVAADFVEEIAGKMKSETETRYWARKRHEKEIKDIIAMHVSIIE